MIPQFFPAILLLWSRDRVASKVSSMVEITRELVSTVYHTIGIGLDVLEEHSVAVTIHLSQELLVSELPDVIIAMWDGL